MSAADEQLLLQVKNGNREAYRQLVEQHMKGAYSLAFGFVNDHDAAQDIAQDAFVRAYTSIGSFRGESQFGTWLYRIVVNLSLNRVKQDQKKMQREVPVFAGEAFVAAEETDQIATGDTRYHIERALHELPTLQRAVVILRHFDGLSTKQVSEILRCSEGTVKTHLFRGMEKLRKKLKHLMDESR
jgi:RNA polymerase sigma-70 factor (ECF subfamily)